MNNFVLFNSLFYKTKLNYTKKDSLVKDITRRYEISPILKPLGWSDNVHSSFYYEKNSNDFLYSRSGIPLDLVDYLNEKINFLNFDENLHNLGKFHVSEIWYNAYKENQYQHPHRHHNFEDGNKVMFSAIWYLKFNPLEHTATRFYNPNFDFEKMKNFSTFSYIPPVEENDLIIFPSIIKHDVPKQTSNNLRITIAFNIDCIFY
jgi:hypothetical protein